MFKKLVTIAALALASFAAQAGTYTDTIGMTWRGDMSSVFLLSGPSQAAVPPTTAPVVEMNFETRPWTLEVIYVNSMKVDGVDVTPVIVQNGSSNVVKWDQFSWVSWTRETLRGNIIWELGENIWAVNGNIIHNYTLYAATSPTASVPLPGTALLLGLGMTGFGIRSLRRSQVS